MDSLEDDLALIHAVDAVCSGESSSRDALRHFALLQEDAAVITFKLQSVVVDVGQLEIAGVTGRIESRAQSLIRSYIRSEGCLQNPVIPAAIRDLVTGKIVLSDHAIPFNTLKRSTYYKQLLEPMGIRRGLIGIIPGKQHESYGFTTARYEDRGPYLARHLRRARLFQRHMARALYINQFIEQRALDRQIFERLLNRLHLALIVVDDERRVLFYNDRAENLVAKSLAVSVADNLLEIGSTAHKRSNFDHWWQILTASCTSDGARFPVQEAGAVWEIEASRLPGSIGGDTKRRSWLLTLKQKPEGSELSEEYLSARFGLTKSEFRVCVALCSSGDAISAARALGSSTNTVRSHLKSVFKKTGTRNQLELAIKLYT